jgi:hypothetical protein
MTKRNILLAKLNSGWVSLADLMSVTGWQAHTVRGAISTLMKKGALNVERKRENGTTFYRTYMKG